MCGVSDEVVTQVDAHLRRTRRDNTLLQDYVVEETIGNKEMNKDEMWRLFFSTLDQVIVNQSSLKQTCTLAIKIQNYMLLSLLFNMKIATFWM